MTLESFCVFSFSLCLKTIRERSKHVAKLNTLGVPIPKRNGAPPKSCVFLQSPTSSVEDLLPASWLETKNNDGHDDDANDIGGNDVEDDDDDVYNVGGGTLWCCL